MNKRDVETKIFKSNISVHLSFTWSYELVIAKARSLETSKMWPKIDLLGQLTLVSCWSGPLALASWKKLDSKRTCAIWRRKPEQSTKSLGFQSKLFPRPQQPAFDHVCQGNLACLSSNLAYSFHLFVQLWFSFPRSPSHKSNLLDKVSISSNWTSHHQIRQLATWQDLTSHPSDTPQTQQLHNSDLRSLGSLLHFHYLVAPPENMLKGHSICCASQ